MNTPNQFQCYLIGRESLLLQCAETLRDRGHTISGVISNEPAIINWLTENDIPHIAHDAHLFERLRQESFDYLFSITNLSIIADEILELPQKGAINFHDGPLPRYAGLHATSWALMNQEQSHGITWHTMSSGVDKGEILSQTTFPIEPGETAFTLNAKCYAAAIDSFPALVDALATNQTQPRTQDFIQRTYFSKYQRPAAAGTIAWTQPANEISALVRALNFGGYTNPLALPKLPIQDQLFIVPEITIQPTPSTSPPGIITAIEREQLQIATTSTDIAIRQLLTSSGTSISIADFVRQTGLRVGDTLSNLPAEKAAQLTELNQAICRREAFWVKQLQPRPTIELPYANHQTVQGEPEALASRTMSLPQNLIAHTDEIRNPSDHVIAAFALYLARLSGTYTYQLGFSHSDLQQELAGFEQFFATHVPLNITVDAGHTLTEALSQVYKRLTSVKNRKTYALDTPLRHPELKALQKSQAVVHSIVVAQTDQADEYTPSSGSELTVLVSNDGTQLEWRYDPAVYEAEAIAVMQGQFATFLQLLAVAPGHGLSETSLLTEAERRQLLVAWNETTQPYPEDQCIHHLFEAQASQTPEAVALVFEDQAITYQALNARANQLAHHLQKEGVGPETRVGVFMERSLEMMVGLLGLLKAGGAYVPLDPTYPQERIAFMVEDAQVPIIISQDSLRSELPNHQAEVICLDTDWDTIAQEPEISPQSDVTSDNLSYVIYTSGSTGKPKGVMVRHQNVVNFFAGMDEVIPHDPPGVWLAVTSLSFDISVLELFWTLSRGFKVVLYADKVRQQAALQPANPHANKPIDFSLFYFASEENEAGVADKYQLLMDGAKYADQHGYVAVWTPERHFHAFGGLYPNPSVASAAIAAITERVDIRAGSCVLPLHSPIRVAEDWALVDNLSRGRVGIAFAAGWQSNDFVLQPANYADRKEIMFRDIEVVQQLWRGETVPFPGPNGKDIPVNTLPRPIQPELPIWITVAGNPETFRMAGERGFNLLTHLLGQSVEDLAEKVAIYRRAWQENGHSGKGHISLMLHTLVGEDDEVVREIVRQPMINYLRSSVALIKAAAWHFPTFKQQAAATGRSPAEIFESEDLTDEDMEALLDFSFNRYFKSSGLFGTKETCLKMVNHLKSIDIDEIACLIDFGVPSKQVQAHLPYLTQLKEEATPQPEDDYSIANLIKQHQVSHLQCTPSMARMLATDPKTRQALRKLQVFMVGGEAFPADLAAQLTEIVSGKVINMYGPTETTIWSSIYEVKEIATSVSIGKPIANTQLYILGEDLQPTPVGVPGELYIGGDGVVRGYLNRPSLTEERFIPDPFADQANRPNARLYRTGDLARYLPSGNIEFLGRLDHQVKIRGYRIELGEIESLLKQHSTVQDAVVIAREDTPGDQRLVGYLILEAEQTPDRDILRGYLKQTLPEFMLPAQFVSLDTFPLTPNNKIDRKALPAPEFIEQKPDKAYTPPSNNTQQTIATIWQTLLNVPRLGLHDNFFEMGGHSLLAVQAHREMCSTLKKEISITDMFRFPTIQSLADYLQQSTETAAQPSQNGSSRAEQRRKARARRQRARSR